MAAVGLHIRLLRSRDRRLMEHIVGQVVAAHSPLVGGQVVLDIHRLEEVVGCIQLVSVDRNRWVFHRSLSKAVVESYCPQGNMMGPR